MRTTITFEGNLADDPQVRFTPSGKQITGLTVQVNRRRQMAMLRGLMVERGGWLMRLFRTLAESIVESLAKGIGR